MVLSDFSDCDGDSFDSSEDDLDYVRDMMVQAAIEEVEQSRFRFRQPNYRDINKVFNWRDIIKENSKRFFLISFVRSFG